MWQRVSQGTIVNLNNVTYDEINYVEEGQRARLVLNLRIPVDSSITNAVLSQMRSRGVTDAAVSAPGSTMEVSWRKGFPWAAAVIAIIIGLIVLAILVVGWEFYKDVADDIGPIAGVGLTVGGLGIIAVGGILAFAFLENNRASASRSR